jgi:adenylyltransferase/sulfurtransferase
MDTRAKDLERYSRQLVLPQVGEVGQRRLAAARVAIIGIGALGSVSAPLLARAGVGVAAAGGCLRLIDRDYVDLNNLQRSGLFTEADAEASIPKALAAAEHLRALNSTIAYDPHVTHVDGENIEALLTDVELVVDGSDNFELRYLINEACDKLSIPWVYGGVIGADGMCFSIVPGKTPCFRCLSPVVPVPGSYPTCASAGVLGTASAIVASLQATEAIKLLLGASDVRAPGLIDVDLWHTEAEVVTFERDPDCPTCAHHAYELLGAASGATSTALCGRDEYQVIPAHGAGGRQEKRPPVSRPPVQLDLAQLADRLRTQGDVLLSPYLLTFDNGTLRFKLFADGRMMLKGAADEAAALSVYSEYVGL